MTSTGSQTPLVYNSTTVQDGTALAESFWERAWRLARRTARIGFIMALALGCPTVLFMLATAVCAAVVGVTNGYVGMVKNQYNAVERMMVRMFVPEPEPEPDFYDKLAKRAAELIRRVDVNLLAILLVVVAILVSMWLFFGYAYYSLRRVTMRCRGVQFEAMRPGSVFVPGEIPKCQVQIMVPGLLIDTHQGYGIRIQNWLVVPLHVVSPLQEILLVGPRGKLLVSSQFEESRLHNDVAYIYLDSKQWVTLGNATASTSPSLNGYVRCTGPKGYSSGTLSKTRAVGMLKYMGSTISGMSGAAYMMADKVLGMHTGAAGDFNLGVSTTLFMSELKYKTRAEAAYLPSKNNGEDAAFVNSEVGHRDSWTAKFIDRLAKDTISSTKDVGWKADFEVDFDEQLEWDSASTSKKESPIQLATLMMQKNQGVDGGETQYNLVSQKVIDDIKDLQERMVVVEKYLEAKIKAKVKEAKEIVTYQCDQCDAKTTSAADLELHKKKHLRFKCDICEVSCQSELRLANHVANAHKKVTGESAYPGDARVSIEVKENAFLGKRSSSPPKKKNVSRRSSSLSGQRKDYQQWEIVQNQIQTFQKSIDRLCSAVLQGTAGRSSDIAQK